MEAGLIITEEEKMKQLALSDLERAKQLTVVDGTSYRDCCMMELQIKDSIKTAEEKMEPVVSSTRKAWKDALKLLDDIVSPANLALGIVQDKRIEYESLKEREAAKKQQEDSKAAMEKAKADATVVADILESSGEIELSKQVRENVPAPVVNVELDIPQIKNIRTRDVWEFKIVDQSKVSRAYMTPDEKKIQWLVNSQHVDAAKIVGGIEVWCRKVPVGAAKK